MRLKSIYVEYINIVHCFETIKNSPKLNLELLLSRVCNCLAYMANRKLWDICLNCYRGRAWDLFYRLHVPSADEGYCALCRVGALPCLGRDIIMSTSF